MKVAFCIPTVTRPYQVCLDSLKESIPLIQAAGWEDVMVTEVGCPYISSARSIMLRKALDAKADVIVFIDHDLSWRPQDLLTLIEAEGDVVGGTYRFKTDEERYMGALIPDIKGIPQIRKDGGLKAHSLPGGFLKLTERAVSRFIAAYPELVYGSRHTPHVDLFNHGAHEGVWYSEDYAFCRRWLALGGELVLIPDIDLNHHSADKVYAGNFHQYLMKQPGGCNHGN